MSENVTPEAMELYLEAQHAMLQALRVICPVDGPEPSKANLAPYAKLAEIQEIVLAKIPPEAGCEDLVEKGLRAAAQSTLAYADACAREN